MPPHRQAVAVRHNAMMDLNLSKDIQEFLARTKTINFLLSARQFVALLELDNIDKAEFIKRSHSTLVDLYATGHKFEEIPLKYSSAESDFDDEKLFTDKNVRRISELGHEAYYWEVFDPTYTEQAGQPELDWKISDKEASLGWLVDDFFDIYRDLKIELNKIDTIGTNEAIEDALWQLRWGFFHHWGNHCLNAMRYLHYWHYEGKNHL